MLLERERMLRCLSAVVSSGITRFLASPPHSRGSSTTGTPSVVDAFGGPSASVRDKR